MLLTKEKTNLFLMPTPSAESASDEIFDNLAIAEVKDLIQQKYNILHLIESLPEKDKIACLQYISCISLDDGVTMLLQIYEKDHTIEERIIKVIANLYVMKKHYGYIQRVKHTLDTFIRKNPKSNKGKEHNKDIFFHSIDVLKRVNNLIQRQAPSFIIENEKKFLYRHPFIKQYALDTQVQISNKYKHVQDMIDDYYAKLLVHKEYKPLELETTQRNTDIIKTTIHALDFIKDMIQYNHQGERKGHLYPLVSSKKIIIDQLTQSIKSDSGEYFDVIKDNTLGRWILIGKNGEKYDEDYNDIFIKKCEDLFIGSAIDFTLDEVLLGAIVTSTGPEDDKGILVDFFGEEQEVLQPFHTFYTHRYNQILICEDGLGNLTIYDRYGRKHYHYSSVTHHNIEHVDSYPGCIFINIKTQTGGGFPSIGINPQHQGDISLDTKKNLFLLNIIDNPSNKNLQDFEKIFGFDGYNKQMQAIADSNYFFDSPWHDIMLKNKKNIKHYIAQLSLGVKNELGIYNIYKKILGIVKDESSEDKLLRSIFGDGGTRHGKNSTKTEDFLQLLHKEHKSLPKEDGDGLDKQETVEGQSGDPIQSMGGINNISFSKPIDDMLSIGVFDTHKDKKRHSTSFHYTPQLYEPTDNIQVTIQLDQHIGPKILPKNLNSIIDQQSIVCKDSANTIVPCQIQIDDTGFASVIPPAPNCVVQYQLQLSAAVIPIPHISSEQYAKFAKNRIAQNPNCDLSSNLEKIPIECEPFIHSIISLSPREKILAIEDFIATVWYYDRYNDAQRSDSKKDKPLTTQIQMSMDRVYDLCLQYPEKREILQQKLFAGVCYEMQILRMMLHRRVGLLSGFNSGLHPHGERLLGPHHQHANGFVIFPCENDEVMLIEVDGIKINVDGTISGGGIEIIKQESNNNSSMKKKVNQTISSQEDKEQKYNLNKEKIINILQLADQRKQCGLSQEGLLYEAIKQRRNNLTRYQKNKITNQIGESITTKIKGH